MAETDTILQLGIEAAREGNREEARNLFNLVTRQDPNNAQGWLWLAGVADGPEERRAALERVVALEPNNEMAVRGLQSMGVSPQSVSSSPVSAPPLVEVPTPSAPARDLSPEEMYASELDSAFDDYDTVEKVAPPPREYEPTPLDSGEPATERVRLQPRRANARRGRDDVAAPPQRRWLFLALIGAIAIAVLLLFILPQFRRQRNDVANNNGGLATSPTSDGGAGINSTGGVSNTGGMSDTTVLTGTNPLTDTNPLTSTGDVSGTTGVTNTGDAAQPSNAAPTDVPAQPAQPAASDTDLAAANPQTVDVGTQLSANGYNFTYPNASYTAVLGKQVGGATAQGNFVLVLVQVGNTTGTAQPIAADYFVLKDAQGRVYNAQPQSSSAYVRRGVNADLSQEDALPADGLLYSVPLIFDVQPGATNLVLFARGNTAQGFPVLNAAP